MGLINWFKGFRKEVIAQRPVSNKLQLKKGGVIPSKYKEYWFIQGDGIGGSAGVRVYTEDPGEEEEYFYCVATDLDKAYKLYNKFLEV